MDSRLEQSEVTEEQGNVMKDKSCTPTPSSAAAAIKQHWNLTTSRELLEKVSKDAKDELEKIEKALNPSKGNNKKKKSSAVRPDGSELALTAFEDVRWFVMTNDADNLNDDDNGSEMVLKGTEFQSILLINYSTTNDIGSERYLLIRR